MRISAIVTLYNPSSTQTNNVISYSKYVDRVFLCDNSCTDNSKLFTDISNSHYISDKSNKGISGAFNEVLKSKLYDWKEDDFIVFFDQDSKLSSNIILKLINTYIELERSGYRIGCINTAYLNQNNNKVEVPKKTRTICEGVFEVEQLITSGMVSRYGRLRDVSFFNRNIFLDMADWDLCWRLRSHQYICCVDSNVQITHAIGQQSKRILFFEIRVWDPLRTYYQVRDGLYIFNEKYINVSERKKLIRMILLYPILGILFLNNKQERLHYFFRGIHDFRNGITGDFKEVE